MLGADRIGKRGPSNLDNGQRGSVKCQEQVLQRQVVFDIPLVACLHQEDKEPSCRDAADHCDTDPGESVGLVRLG